MTELRDGRVRQGYLAILVCIVGLSFSPLFYKLGYLTGLHVFWLNVIRLSITEAVMAAIAFSNPKHRRALLRVSKRSSGSVRWRERFSLCT